MEISVVISYCRLDSRFIETTIKQSLLFSNDIIIVCFDKLLNGSIENFSKLNEIQLIDSNCIRIVVLPYDQDQGPRHHHNKARWEAQKYTKNKYVLFLDADEIPEGEIAKNVLNKIDFLNLVSVSFRCYWYFRSAKYQATTKESCGILIDKNKFNRDHFFSNNERWGLTMGSPNHIECIVDANGLAFFHHFSWVRTKEEMLIKTSSWGHRHDRDWKSLIEQEFSHDFNGTDFVHRYSYNIVEDKFNLSI